MKAPWGRGGLRTWLVLLALVLTQPNPLAFWIGAALVLLGVVLHVYAKGCLRQDQVVATGGPYRFVRHPFYSATFVIDEGIALLSGCWILAAALPVWWLLVYVPVMRGEEAYLSQAFPDIYPAYLRRLPRLIPFRRPLPPGGEGFTWANPNIVADTVIPRALRLLASPVLFFTWGNLRAHGVRPLAQGDVLLLSALALLLALHGLARLLARHLKEGRRAVPARCPVRALRIGTAAVVLVIAASVRWGELEIGPALASVATLVLAASVALYLRRGLARLAAEGMGLVGIAMLCELPWLAVLPVLVYAALMLDEKATQRAGEPAARSAVRPASFIASFAFPLLLLGGIVLAVTKELL